MDGKALVEAWRSEVSIADSPEIFGDLIIAIDAALAQARAEEREACAKMVEAFLIPQECDMDDMQELADDIRARRMP